MDEQRIWAPWRIGYVAGDESLKEQTLVPQRWSPGAEEDCFLCRAAAEYADPTGADRLNLVVARGEQTVTLLNRYPYTNGHLLVAPLRHVGQLHELTSEEHLAAMKALSTFTELISAHLSAAGFNIGLNLGRVAGAGVPGHLHWHLVPRWSGDNNFMPTVAGTRVIPQSLDAVWEVLRNASEGENGS
ncbi:HIT family protein [Bythopirellula polymerisocia]|jgi:ATP adenylyltransferase|uniref:AP-4-A phosphorylase n=1 Tax=Bythopirellula polymerisocia TaxID=2528003 RepID=A0A5C6CUT5_9BACT|nr:HIT domain-containing protein [Bythopirellula polymerisocia]TWU28188.1 AP-4-A phosphorylase [Bythopirellula polymerisocia]